MTKQAYRETQRCQPLGEQGMARVRQILADRQAAKVNEVFVDAFSASAIVAVYDALNEKCRAAMLTFPVSKACAIAFKLIK